MEPQNEKAEEGDRLEEATGEKEFVEESKEKAAEMSRKEKRKAMKKLKRKQVRKEIASKEREDAEAKLNDPAEQEKLKAIEEEEARKREKELREFEESERAWREAMEIKRKKEEEEERRWKELEELRKLEASRDGECGEDGEYEYIEEGPPEIIFKGNEIILRKNKVRVPKKSVPQVEGNEIADRPTSNPLPPGTEALPKYQNVSSAQQILDSVAQEVPNFGTEQDKAHCPFHLKTGACRFGPRCSRVHFYPDKSCTILMKNMYNGPGIAWEHDEGLEYTDEEAEHCYEEFYEDVHTEFLKYGELINFKVCRNGSFHLKGNVYVHYRSLESAVLAYQSINGRYFAGKQVNCEFVNISRWKVAICGEYMKSRLKTCSRGSACNFIHCFRNPGGDYEWADFDKPPPRFWIRKMTALFGYSDEYLRHMEREYSGSLRDCRSDQLTDSQRQPSRRSRSRDHDHVNVGSKPSYRSRDSSRGHRHSRHEENHHGGDGSPNSTRDGSLEREIYKEPRHGKETSRHESKWSEHSPTHRVPRKRIHERYSDDDSGDDDGRGETSHKRKSSRRYPRRGSDSEVQEQLDDQEESRTHWSSSERRSRKEDDREGSSASQEESRAHDRVHAVGDKSQRQRSSSRYSHERDSSESRHRRHRGSYDGENDRRRSVETSPRDKDRDKSKQRHSYNKTGDPDSSNRGRKGKQGRESQEVKRNASGSSSDEEREERHKERSHSSSHRKRRRSSQHSSHEQTPKEPEEIERWRPM
ncbi:zinc finger CCCH domain-containing protein 5 [Brassica napus]|uniref:zinc finger CCCH domain-containing protein 5 n=1 Tax=Brassica napus TaxID=3708 RepID=UPI0006AB2E3D|nr:zinc finger CCCH domain-containing protein 5 [Brassica napus]